MRISCIGRSALALAFAVTLPAAACDSDAPDDGATDSSAEATDGSGMASGDSNASASGASSSSGSASGSGSGSDSGSSASTTGDVDPGDDAAAACVARINAFRATQGLPAYARWAPAEACTDEQSGADAAGGTAHANFGDCEEWAQNTCPNWPSETAVVQDCLQVMWDEGPGEDYNKHGHYLAMSSTDYTEVACGFHENPDGTVWANQNFR